MDKITFKEIIAAILAYGWMIALAMLGGLVKFIRQLNESREPKPLKVIFVRFTGEMIISAFAGIITVLICVYWKLDLPIMAALAGVAGHLGGKAIDTFIVIWKSIISGGKV